MQTIQNSSIQTSLYRDLPFTQLQESLFNPRKRFEQASLEELAQSIRAQRVLAPLLVREVESERFEIVAVSRRFRASQIAGLEPVPVRIVNLSDAEAQLAMAVENLQREDVHPLEEARAFANLSQQQYDIATVAAKVGRSERFVAERIRLNELIPAVAEALLEDKITVHHALLIAKLPASQQPEAFTAAFRRMWTTHGDTETLVPVKELAAWIETNMLLDLAAAPFDRHDAALLPEAGTCMNPYLESELLDAAAKRYRVNIERIAEAVAAEFAARQKKREERKATAAPSAPKSATRKSAKSKR